MIVRCSHKLLREGERKRVRAVTTLTSWPVPDFPVDAQEHRPPGDVALRCILVAGFGLQGFDSLAHRLR